MQNCHPTSSGADWGTDGRILILVRHRSRMAIFIAGLQFCARKIIHQFTSGTNWKKEEKKQH
jgi:hypothetical protein